MNLKKLYIEQALYPAMNLLQNSRVTTYTRELLSTEFMSEQQRTLRLRQQLTELLQLCKAQVPVYGGLSFSDLDLRREPLDCLQAVDPVTVQDFLASAPDYLRKDADLTGLHHRICGGNPPTRIYLTQEQIERYEAARWRGLSWYGVTYGSPSVLLWDKPRSPFVLQEEPYMKNRLSISVCAMTDRTVELTAREIDQFQPEYITGSVSSLLTMARAMLHSHVQLTIPLKVVTITKGIGTDEQRRELEEAFGCPVAQVLSGRLEGLVAYMCPEGHLHVTAENCYVEVLDPRTWAPVQPGQPGLVAVTNLLDQTMPHLRVILDCMAVMTGEACACGRTLPVLEQVRNGNPA